MTEEVHYEDHNAAFLKWLHDQLVERLEGIGAHVEGQVKEKLSRTQPVMRVGGQSTARMIGLDPSLPGEPPKMIEGNLRLSIASEVVENDEEVAVFVGSKKGISPYARALELGFYGVDSKGRNHNLAPRPYLTPTLAEEIDEIERILKS